MPYDLVIADAPATGHGLAILNSPRTFARAAGAGPIARQGHTIHEMIADPARTGVLAVTRAEEMPISETGALRDALATGLGLELEWVVANALEPDRFSPREATLMKEHAGHPAVDRALGSHAHALAQRAQLARLHRLTDRHPVHLTRHPGDPDLDALATELERQL
jgi:anion-transporting  ArsA/GET3 family ATPase